MNMMEKMARAIAIAHGRHPDELSGKPLGGADWEPCAMWEHNIEAARAALEVLREPTEEMWKTALRSGNCPALPADEKQALAEFWQAMIDEALKE